MALRRVALAEIELEARPFQIRLDPRPGQLKAALRREGQLVPVVLQKKPGKLRVIDGHRRCEALAALGQESVDATVLDVGDGEALRLAFVLNAERKTLSPADRWNSLRVMARRGWTNEKIGKALGMHRTRVSTLRNLFPDLAEVDLGIVEGWLLPSHLRALRSLLPRKDWPKWLRVVKAEKLSARALFERIGAGKRRREPPYVAKEAGGALILRGFRFEPASADPEEMWRAVTQLDDALDRIRGWLRRKG